MRQLPDDIIELLQPFISDKLDHNCDLERQEKVNHAADGKGFRHRGHAWCRGMRNGMGCGCPCHWPDDVVTFKLLEFKAEYELPEFARDWLERYIVRETAEAKRLRSLADGRDAMVARVKEVREIG